MGLKEIVAGAFCYMPIDEQKDVIDQVRHWADRKRHDRLFMALSGVKDELDNLEVAERERKEFVPGIPAKVICDRYSARGVV